MKGFCAMIKTIMLAALLSILLPPTTAIAKPELVSRVAWKTDVFKLAAELYFDKDTKRTDLWVDYLQGTTEDDRIAFKATSLDTRFREADFKLRPQPLTKFEGRAVQIYDGLSVKDDEPNANRGMALLFKFPVSELAAPTMRTFLKNFPNAFVRDPAGKFLYVKTLLCRVTEYQVYPVAAFDVEPDL